MKNVIVTGSFDNLNSLHVRFLRRASQLGALDVLVWSDQVMTSLTGYPPKFPEAERIYLLQALRYVRKATMVHGWEESDIPPNEELDADIWAVLEDADTPEKRVFCQSHGLDYQIIRPDELEGFPPKEEPIDPGTHAEQSKKVIVTGCFDWLHSGHVRFFEEVSEMGALYVVLGHDENVSFLKGAGHPMFPAVERQFMVQAIRHVREALISSGHGWLDAEPEIRALEPDIYAVNEDGDRPEKRAFCEQAGIQYVVLKREPKAGLPRREAKALRGF